MYFHAKIVREMRGAALARVGDGNPGMQKRDITRASPSMLQGCIMRLPQPLRPPLKSIHRNGKEMTQR